MVKGGYVKEYDIVKHSYSNQIMKGNKNAVATNDQMITLTTRGDCYGVCVKDSKLVGGYGSKGSTGQYRTQNRIYDSQAAAPTINTGFNPNFITNRGGKWTTKN